LKAFHFRLERILEWHAARLLVEEAELRRITAQAVELERAAMVLDQGRTEAENGVRLLAQINGSDLTALAAYRLSAEKRRQILREKLIETQKLVIGQRGKLMEARRKHRLVEKLRERRVTEWTMESNREIEQNASESHLARLSREK